MRKLMLGLVVVGLLVGCKSQPVKDDTKAGVEERGVGTQPKSATGPSTAPVQQSSLASSPLRDPNNILSKRSIYYEYDSTAIKDEYRPLIEAHARYLSSNPSAEVVIEGNCDERGSREYNLALGQRRAEGVKRAMTALGATEKQIEAVSLGEEKPRATGHDEASYTENRRSDIVYRGE